MQKSKIEWCDYTWNPITGCLHECEYCYARKIAERFKNDTANALLLRGKNEEYGPCRVSQDGYPFPSGFMPTLYPHRLDEPAKLKKPANIFVCSMADLFGDWVPDEWIQAVFKACEDAPQHRYLFLTKNPGRYCALANAGALPKNKNFWYGTTITKCEDKIFGGGVRYNTFLSIEPLHEYLDVGIGSFGGARWVIVGAETGNRKDKITPKREWIANIVNDGAIIAKVFLKNNLADIWGKPLIQEYPWEKEG